MAFICVCRCRYSDESENEAPGVDRPKSKKKKTAKSSKKSYVVFSLKKQRKQKPDELTVAHQPNLTMSLLGLPM